MTGTIVEIRDAIREIERAAADNVGEFSFATKDRMTRARIALWKLLDLPHWFEVTHTNEDE